MLNMMCAMRIVPKPVATLRLRNSVSSDAPITISGVVIGRKISRLSGPRPRHQRPDRGGEDRGDQGDLEAQPHCRSEPGVCEWVEPVVDREALPGEVETPLGVVERERDHDR